MSLTQFNCFTKVERTLLWLQEYGSKSALTPVIERSTKRHLLKERYHLLRALYCNCCALYCILSIVSPLFIVCQLLKVQGILLHNSYCLLFTYCRYNTSTCTLSIYQLKALVFILLDDICSEFSLVGHSL